MLQGIGDHRSEAYVTVTLGELHQQAGHTTKAEQVLEQALQSFHKIGDTRGADRAVQAMTTLRSQNKRCKPHQPSRPLTSDAGPETGPA
jgi:uncharacterized protein HemY